MPRRLQGLIAALLLGFTGLLLTPASPAIAQDNCGVVVDGANVLDDIKLQPAINDLNKVGADPHVVTVTSLGTYPTLDALIDAKWQSCPSWKAPSSGRKSNLVVFAISMNEQKVGIFTTQGEPIGRAFEKAGGEQVIYSQYMGPKLRDRDFTGAFVAGMNQAEEVISSASRPQGGDVTNVNFGGIGKVIGYMFGALFVLVVLILAVWYSRRLLREREAREAVRQRALRARDAITSILQALRDGHGETLRQARVAKYAKVGGPRATELTGALTTVTLNITAASDAMTAAASASANPEDLGLTIAVYRALAERYEEALRHAEAARAADRQITELAKTIDSELQQIKTGLAEAEARLQRQLAAVDQLRAEGIRAEDFDSQLDSAAEHLAAASVDQGQLSALESLRLCNETLERNENVILDLIAIRSQLTQAIPALAARLNEVRTTLDAARQCFGRITTTYAPDSWESVAGNGSEATARVTAAEAALIAARTQSDLATQQWEAAVESIDTGNRLLDEAIGLLHSITELEGNLQRAQEQAQPEIDAAQADIDRAAAYIREHDADIRDSLEEEDLRQARATLDAACAEFAESQPNYLRVVELALAANAHADRILEQAMNEHEAAQRLRRQAATALDQARAAVSKAAEYINDHESYVSSSAKSNLRAARQDLQTAEGSRNPATVLRHAKAAQEDADSAYRTAKRNFQSRPSSGSGYGYNSGSTNFTYVNVDLGGDNNQNAFNSNPGIQDGSNASWGSGDAGVQSGSSGGW